VADCERDPARAEQINVAGTMALRDAVSRLQPQALLLYTSTAQLYVPEAGTEVSVLDETAPLEARNVYARTKWAGEQALLEGAYKDGLDVTVLRPFNHTHRTQAPIFFLPHLYQAMQRHRTLSSTEELAIPVGNLSLERDIGAVSDLVGAMGVLLERPGQAGRADIFNVCSGLAKNLASLGHKLAGRLGVRVRFVTDAARVRPGEPRSVCGSHARLTAATGWTPQVRTEDELIEAFLG
jgi:GDP-4-dehydro-6-deoxy-D-mannose reductase